MEGKRWLSAGLLLGLAFGRARPDDSGPPPADLSRRTRAALSGALAQLPSNQPGQTPGNQAQQQQQASDQSPDNSFAQNQSLSDQDGESAGSTSPQMLGDFFGGFACRFVTVRGFLTTQTFRLVDAPGGPILVPVATTVVPTTATRTVCVPIASAGVFKISENESPIPVDRVFFNYNFFGDVSGPAGSANTTTTNVLATAALRSPTAITAQFPAVPNTPFDVHREALGFEKTFFSGDASFELRMPVLQVSGDGSLTRDGFGDLTGVFKYAFYNDPTTRDVISGGLAVTAPTGPAIETVAGKVRSTILQPWGGFQYNAGDLYVLGFTSIAVPTDSRDVTLLFNDLAAGYWLYRAPSGSDNVISSLIPTFEVHVTTPLDNRGPGAPIVVPEVVDLTAGAHVGLFGRWRLSLGVVTPVTGPRPFEVEAFVQVNRWF